MCESRTSISAGQVPQGWEVRRLEQMIEVLDHMRVPISAEERFKRQGTVPYYGANGQQGWIDDYLFDEPLILIAEDGGNFDDFASHPIAYKISGKSWVNNHAHILRARNGNNLDFIFFTLAHKDVRRYIAGSTRSKLTQRELKSIEVLAPLSPAEQYRIAAVLDTLDEAIAKTEAVIAKLKEVRAGLLHDLLTRGVDLSACDAQAGEHGQLRDFVAHSDQFKDSPLGRIPRGWEVSRLIDASLKIADRDHTTPVYLSEGVRMVSPTQFVGEDEIDFESCPLISIEAHLENRRKTDVKVDDVIIHRIGAGLGQVRLVKDGMPEFSILHSLAMIRPKPHRLLSRFLCWALQVDVVQLQMGLGTQSIGVPDLGLDKIGGVLLPIPGLPEQICIADVLDQTAENLRAELAILGKLQRLKSGLMNDLLTGRVRVPENIMDGGGHT